MVKKRTIVVTKMAKLLIAIAGFDVNMNIAIMIGMETPPPPIPAILLSALITEKTISPAISRGKTGNTPLWPQKPSLLIPHTFQG